MLRNIACRLTQEMVAEILNANGLCGLYDFIYMPRSPVKSSNLGYVFVNFTSTESAQLAKEQLDGKPFGAQHSNSQKCCEVSVAHSQGPQNPARRRRRGGAALTVEPLWFDETGGVVTKN